MFTKEPLSLQFAVAAKAPWKMLAKTYVHKVTVPDNVVDLSQWRRS